MRPLMTFLVILGFTCSAAGAELVSAGPAQPVGTALLAQVNVDGLGLGCALGDDIRAQSLLFFVENESSVPVVIDPALIRLFTIKRKGRKEKRKPLEMQTPEQHRWAQERIRAALRGTGRGGGSGWSSTSTAGTPPGDPGQPIVHMGGAGTSAGGTVTTAAAASGARTSVRMTAKSKSAGLGAGRTRSQRYLSGNWNGKVPPQGLPGLERVEVPPQEAAAGFLYFEGRLGDLLEVIVPVEGTEYRFLIEVRRDRN